jgi:hypothetical protein
VFHPFAWGQRDPVSEMLCSLKYRKIDKFKKKLDNPENWEVLKGRGRGILGGAIPIYTWREN